MRCPYCRNRLEETSPECPSCRLTFDRACTLLGPMPRLSPGVTDLARALTRNDHRKIRKALDRLSWRFPQISPHVVLNRFPEEHPFELHVFWLFNSGAFSAASQKGGANHDLLLVMDPWRGKSAIIAGYGLEPFLGDDALDHLLEMSEPAWRASDWTSGILDLIDGLSQLLESAAREVANGFGGSPYAVSPKKGEF